MIEYYKVIEVSKKLSILYFEDDINFQKETGSVFSELFLHVDLVSNAKDGLLKYMEYYKKENKFYDIVITDINMPIMNGVELCKKIYEIHKEQSIIVISAHDESEYLLELVNIGIEQFLIKPLDFDILLNVIYSCSSRINNSELKKNMKIIDLNYDFFWDREEKILLHKKKCVKLTKRESFIMELLIKNKNKISTYEEIINTIYDDPSLISNDSLKMLISRLRKKIPKQTLESIYGFGYRLIF
ncbi:MAG: response regulator transcription factor [Campylobacteraceae bacterium]|nr:response regulator transcription factor [Campylobacteraceae bacterium]